MPFLCDYLKLIGFSQDGIKFFGGALITVIAATATWSKKAMVSVFDNSAARSNLTIYRWSLGQQYLSGTSHQFFCAIPGQNKCFLFKAIPDKGLKNCKGLYFTAAWKDLTWKKLVSNFSPEVSRTLVCFREVGATPPIQIESSMWLDSFSYFCFVFASTGCFSGRF